MRDRLRVPGVIDPGPLPDPRLTEPVTVAIDGLRSSVEAITRETERVTREHAENERMRAGLAVALEAARRERDEWRVLALLAVARLRTWKVTAAIAVAASPG
jgi:hypothetical protein